MRPQHIEISLPKSLPNVNWIPIPSDRCCGGMHLNKNKKGYRQPRFKIIYKYAYYSELIFHRGFFYYFSLNIISHFNSLPKQLK